MKAQTLEKIDAITFFSFIIVLAIGIGIYVEASSFIYMRTQDQIQAKIESREILYSRRLPTGYNIDVTYSAEIGSFKKCKSFVFSRHYIKKDYVKIVPQKGSCYRPYIFKEFFDIPDLLPSAVALLIGAGALLLVSTWQRYRFRRGADA